MQFNDVSADSQAEPGTPALAQRKKRFEYTRQIFRRDAAAFVDPALLPRLVDEAEAAFDKALAAAEDKR